MTKGEDALDELIAIERDVIHDLRRQLLDPDLSREEMVRLSNSLAYHVNVLNKLLMRKGEKPLYGESLGSLIVKLPMRISQDFMEQVRLWRRMRRLSNV